MCTFEWIWFDFESCKYIIWGTKRSWWHVLVKGHLFAILHSRWRLFWVMHPSNQNIFFSKYGHVMYQIIEVDKVDNCIKAHVGENVIEARYVGSKNNRKTYNIKCPECPFISNRLRKHMRRKHDTTDKQAHLIESKLRVLFNWAQKEDKHGVRRPLLCDDCSVWLVRDWKTALLWSK